MGMMICLAAGLAVGIGLLIWCLIERGKRADAERAAQEAKKLAEASDRIAKQNAEAVVNVKVEHGRACAELDVLRARLVELRERLVKCEDPQTIKDWLDSLGSGGEV